MRDILLGECKWGTDAVDRTIVRELLAKTPLVLADLPDQGADWHVHHALFARTGATPAARRELATHHVVQDALAKAYYALPTTSVASMRGWLFRIAHNKAIDYLRRTSHLPIDQLDEHPLLAEPDAPLEEQELVAFALSVFLQLAPKQRSCVILKDVMGYSLAEISELLDATVPEIKAALHRGRARLRELSKSVEADAPAALDQQERQLLARYVDRFNARDFDAVRAMLADEVRLDLINRTKRRGVAEVGEYFHRYAQVDDWRLALGIVEHRPAILVYDPREESAQPVYFMLLTWDDTQVSLIRDYRYVPYVMRDATVVEL